MSGPKYPQGFTFTDGVFTFTVLKFLPQFRFKHYRILVDSGPIKYKHEVGLELDWTESTIDFALANVKQS